MIRLTGSLGVMLLGDKRLILRRYRKTYEPSDVPLLVRSDETGDVYVTSLGRWQASWLTDWPVQPLTGEGRYGEDR